MMIKQEENSSLKGFVYWVGLALVVGGALSLIYLAVLVVQLIQSPTESELIAWVVANLGEEGVLLAGHINETQFEFHGNDKLQLILLGILGLIAISILTTVVNALITSGISLIKFSKTDDMKEKGQVAT
ncbi:MAG: hypothetical protein P8103_07270 [Candidatus Thiodiazotropha sp.]